MISCEIIQTSNIIQTEYVICRNLAVYAYAYMHVTTINLKRGYEFDRKQRAGFVEGKQRRKWQCYTVISKKE